MVDFDSEERRLEAEAEAAGNLTRIPGGGFVRFESAYGDDLTVVQRARVSYGRGTKAGSSPAGLIYHLIRNNHSSPLEMVEITFHLKMEIFSARQIIRHRTANVNEMSGRYSIMPDEFWEPNPADIREVGGSNKQGSTGVNRLGDVIACEIREANQEAYSRYNHILALGAPREQARAALPLTQMTQFYWKIDAHNFLKFIGLRMEPHAQPEIQLYARAMWAYFSREFPLIADAYDRAVLQGVRLSGPQWTTVFKEMAPGLTREMLIQKALDSGCSKTEAADLAGIIYG